MVDCSFKPTSKHRTIMCLIGSLLVICPASHSTLVSVKVGHPDNVGLFFGVPWSMCVCLSGIRRAWQAEIPEDPQTGEAEARKGLCLGSDPTQTSVVCVRGLLQNQASKKLESLLTCPESSVTNIAFMA